MGEPARGESRLQRLFSAFPEGRAGIGLLLLRITLSAAAAIEGSCLFAGASKSPVEHAAEGVVLVVGGILTLVGFITPVSSFVVAAMAVVIGAALVPQPASNLFDGPFATALTAVMGVAVVLLGPGAYSVDGRLFGRRELVIPRAPDRGLDD